MLELCQVMEPPSPPLLGMLSYFHIHELFFAALFTTSQMFQGI